MERFIVVSHYGAEIIEAEDWDDAVYKAQEGWGSSLVSITLLPREEE